MRAAKTRLVALVAALALLVGGTASPALALACGPEVGVPLDSGCLFTITGSDTPEAADGFAVTNNHGVPLWDFAQDKDLQAIGFPISQRWTDGPFTLQAFQKVILQWDPVRGRMNYYNTLDALANRYAHVELPNVPAHAVLAADAGADFAQVIRNHLAILDENTRIKERFLAEPDWLNLYGLPIQYEAREVNGNPEGLQVLRTQRTVFEIWNVPAPGTTLGQVQLQNVPDKLKRLSNVIIPDAAKMPAAPRDPTLPLEIGVLPWVADGVTDAEARIVDNLRRIADASQAIYGQLLRQPSLQWLKRQPTERTLAATELLMTIAEMPWRRAVRERLLDHNLPRLMLYESDDQWPASFRKALDKPWMKDGVSWDELELVDEFASILRISATSPWSGSYFGKGPQLDELIEQLLDMPFLQTIEGLEVSLIRRLHGTGLGFDYFETAIRNWIPRGGITDDQVLVYLYPRIIEEGDHFPERPELLAQRLDEQRPGFQIERRTVTLPSSGDMLLIIIRSSALVPYISPHTMDVLEQETRRIESLMGEPLRQRFVVLLFWDAPPNVPRLAGTGNSGRIMQFEPWYFANEDVPRTTKAVLIHELAHYYWIRPPEWIYEGAALFMEVRAGYRDRNSIWELQAGCETDRIVDLLDDTRDYGVCYYSLGARLFIDLYDVLGEAAFREGFVRLFRTADVYGLYCQCGFEGKSHVEYVREAFMTDATPEVAARVDRVISRWYYGG